MRRPCPQESRRFVSVAPARGPPQSLRDLPKDQEHGDGELQPWRRLVGKMQVQTTGDAVWQGIFRDDSARLEAELPPDSLVKRALVFEGNPRIERMVFICTPHPGARLLRGCSVASAAISFLRPCRSCEVLATWPRHPSRRRSDKGGVSCQTAFGDSLPSRHSCYPCIRCRSTRPSIRSLEIAAWTRFR